MKFFVNGGFSNTRLLQIILVFTLTYIAILWVTNLLLYVEKIGFTYNSVVSYYLGSEEEFKNPVSYMGLLEVSHFHLFTFAFVLLLLTHLMTFLNISGYLKAFLIFLSFIAGIGNICAGWLIRYVSPGFAYLKIGSFLVFQISFLFLLVFSFFAVRIYQKDREKR